MICSVLGLFCLVSFLSGVVNRRLAAAQRTCNSSVCVHFSDVINRSATARAPPCSEFYAHVCAEWDEDNMESPQELNFRSVVRRLYFSLAMESVPEKYQTNFQKAAAFYQSCLSVLLDGKSELTEISSTLKKIGVHWPERSASADLLVTAANLKQRLDLDSVLVFSMPDTSTLSIQPPSTVWLQDIKRQRYAVDFANNSLEQFNSLWRAFSFRPPNDTEVARLLETEDRFFHYIALAVPLSTNPSITTLTLLNLPLTCSEFSRARWNKMFREAYNALPEAVTSVQIKYRKAFDFACRLVRDLGEPAVQYYAEWLAVKALATYGDRSIAKYFWSDADAMPFGAQSTCFQSTMHLFGEVILLEESHRWHLRTSTLLSKSHLVAKSVRASLSELMSSNRNHPLMNVFLKYSLHDELYNDDRQRLLDSVYATVPDLTRRFFFNRMLLLNVSLNQDTVRSLGFSWEALEDMLRHDGGTVHIQLAALQHHVRMFLQLSYAAYFLLTEDMPPAYNYAALGMLVARQMFAFRRHTWLMAQTYQESMSMHAGEFEVDLEDYSEFSLALDAAQKAVFRTRQYQAQPWLRKSQEFFLVTCFQMCSGRNTYEAQRKLTFAFTGSKSFQAAFSCRSALEPDIASVLSQVKGELNGSEVDVSKDATSLN
ncbi:hypothetical protein HPB50_004206 [Hyalomma asiaticum]|uniref:Uncharacterized protein n=1 Tax=Hyalomma asiaticum TaxID=266040 RepID=A0ACB7TBT1_HYAAI|nr:hypothetical protein HPB50_004206 [Hyalomma asiaticum]